MQTSFLKRFTYIEASLTFSPNAFFFLHLWKLILKKKKKLNHTSALDGAISMEVLCLRKITFKIRVSKFLSSSSFFIFFFFKLTLGFLRHYSTSTTGPFMKKLRRAYRLLIEARKTSRFDQASSISKWRKVLERYKHKSKPNSISQVLFSERNHNFPRISIPRRFQYICHSFYLCWSIQYLFTLFSPIIPVITRCSDFSLLITWSKKVACIYVFYL